MGHETSADTDPSAGSGHGRKRLLWTVHMTGGTWAPRRSWPRTNAWHGAGLRHRHAACRRDIRRHVPGPADGGLPAHHDDLLLRCGHPGFQSWPPPAAGSASACPATRAAATKSPSSSHSLALTRSQLHHRREHPHRSRTPPMSHHALPERVPRPLVLEHALRAEPGSCAAGRGGDREVGTAGIHREASGRLRRRP